MIIYDKSKGICLKLKVTLGIKMTRKYLQNCEVTGYNPVPHRLGW
jgi:hypothetical protein